MTETDENGLASRIEKTGIKLAEALEEVTKAIAAFGKVVGEAVEEVNKIIAMLEKTTEKVRRKEKTDA